MIQKDSIKLMMEIINLSQKIENHQFATLEEGLAFASAETELLQQLLATLRIDIVGRNPRFYNPFLY